MSDVLVTGVAGFLGYAPTTTVEDGVPRFVRSYEDTHGRQT